MRYKSGGGIAVIDLTDFSLVKILASEVTWEALTLSQDGCRLYALDSESAELRVFDTRTLSEIARLSGIGKYPARIFLIPAP